MLVQLVQFFNILLFRGVPLYLSDDQAHILQHKWWTPQQLQTVATSGRYGRQAGVLKLKVKKFRTELEAKGFFLDDSMKRALRNLIERGVNRVPALFLTNPIQQLSSMNLEKYEVVASEPIKGHLINLIT